MSAPRLSTKALKGMVIHHATTRLGWTWDEASEAFDEWFGDCDAHRERIGPEPDEPARCVKCGGPAPFHDPACIVHPGSNEP